MPEFVRSQPEIVARHFSEAGHIDRAVEYWHEAGRQAARRSANREALRHLGAALAAVDTLADTEPSQRLRLELLVESITPSIAVHGYASAELEGVYQQALTLAKPLGDTPQIFPPLYAQWVAAMVLGSFPTAIERAREFVDHAQRQHARLPLLAGRRCMAVCMTWTGKLSEARVTLLDIKEGLDDVASDALGFAYGQDMLAGVYTYLALTHCAMGGLEAGGEYAALAVERAGKVSHLQTMCWVHAHMGLLHGATLHDADRLAADLQAIDGIIEKHELPTWVDTSKWLHGCHASMTGDPRRGRVLVDDAIEGLSSLSFSLWRPVVWLHAAEAAFGAGDAVQAEACARQGLCEVDAGRDALFAPELHRVLATALQAQGAPGAVVEAAYEKALSIARDYDAKLFELRTAVDLAGYWKRQDRSTEAKTLLQNTYSGFSDGFDIPLLNKANRLLEDL